MQRGVLFACVCIASSTRTLPDKNHTDELRLVQEMVNAETRVRAMQTPAPTPAPLTCNDLTGITVGGKDWSDVVKTVCLNWPSTFGQFPAESVVGLQQTLETVMEEGGIWSQLLAKFTEANEDYCLRIEESRTVVPTSRSLEYECAPTLNDEVLAQYPEVVIEATSPLTTGYWANLAFDSTASSCVYSRRDVKTIDIGGTVTIASTPRGCKMVHAGVCYGDCRAGFRPTFLTGWFRPVCTSVCGSTNHPVTCGVGCANTRTSCVSVILNQVKEVTIAASKVAAFFVGGTTGSLIVSAVEQVVKVTEFGFNVLSKVLQIAEVAFTQFAREEAELATLVAIYEIVKTTVGELQGELAQFLGLVEASVPLLLQLIDAQFGWINLDLGWIAGVVMQSGATILEGAFNVTKAFAYGKCEIADDTVAFAVEDVGDSRVLGPWTADGTVNGKPRYRNLLDRQMTLVEWDSRARTWTIFYKDTSFGRGYWWGWLGFGWRRLYESQTATQTFPTTGWRRLEGALPLPYLVSATNGGV